MLGLILLIFLVITLWFGVILCNKAKKEGGEFILAFLGGIFSFLLFIAIVSICVMSSNAASFCRERNRCVDMVEAINENMDSETVSYILSNAVDANNTILRHRQNVNNIFWGVFYSHDIANQELIDIPKITIKTNN